MLIQACTNSNNTSDDQGPALFPQPLTHPLNTDGGYITNTFTGDTIQPLINSLGDTIKTGIAIPTQGKLIHPDSISKPKSFPASQGKIVQAHPNVHQIPDNLTVIPVDESKLKRHNSSTTNSPLLWRGAGGEVRHYILNSTGDTIKTGTPIPTKGKQVPCIFPKSTPALPLRMKDNAICDIQYLDVDQGMSSSYVNCMLEDKSGNLWFGTDGGGVSMYDGKSFVHFTENEGLSNNYVRSILEDKSGNLWFGTDGGGVSMYDGKSFVHFTENEGLSNNYVRSILEDKSGNLWFGTDGGGVSMYDGKSFVHFTENEGLSNNVVWSILEDKSGNLWFGTDGGGVSMYDGKSFVHFTENEGLSNNYVLSILEDKSGNLWFGTYGGGVSMYDGKSFVHFTENEGLSNNVVWSILEDKSGNLWFGTYGGGVSMYDGKSFVHFTENEGLSNNYVWSILEDKSSPQPRVWVSTEKGISLIESGRKDLSYKEGHEKLELKNDKNKLIEPFFSITTLIKEDGLKGLDYFANSVLLDSKNRLWWGSGKALEMLDLNEFENNSQVPVTFLSSLEINETFIDYRNISDSLKEGLSFNGVTSFENYPLNLELPYNRNHLTFHFAAIDWAAPHKLKYQYKLQGLNDNWSAPSTETKADYRNIPYGTYTFKVRAIGESQIWGEPFEYTFTIHPPWWHTWWFRGLMAFVFVLILYLLYRSRTAALRARQKQLEKTVEERTAELVQKNIIVEEQKQVVEKQKEVVEEQKKVVEKQKELVEEKHKEITDSINYAERIQRSFLATKELLDECLSPPIPSPSLP